jgi:serine O-acetyltransferase
MRFKECFTWDLRGGEAKSFLRMLYTYYTKPSYRVVVMFPLMQYFREACSLRFITKYYARLMSLKMCNKYGVEIHPDSKVGRGFRLAHPRDVVIGAGVKIGDRVTIYNGVTLGAKALMEFDSVKEVDGRYPVIGDGVVIFSGAKIVGPVVIGKGTVVGANAVVNKSYSENSVLGGVPARVIGFADPLSAVDL